MPRTYRMSRRAERQQETRQRIVEATVALHEEVGMLATTISDIAARAGVERATVYRHFPDERSLIAACTHHYSVRHPLPDPEAWSGVADPEARLRTALGEIYAHHRRTERMMARVLPEVPRVPAAREVIAPELAYWDRVRAGLAAGWTADTAAATRVRAAIGHAIAFGTWQSLVRDQGLDDAGAVELMVTLVRGLVPAGDPARVELG